MRGKKAISVTLQLDNVTWLKGRADVAGCKSVSELLDRLVTAARVGGQAVRARSVVGTIEIDPFDPLLERADAAVRRTIRNPKKPQNHRNNSSRA